MGGQPLDIEGAVGEPASHPLVGREPLALPFLNAVNHGADEIDLLVPHASEVDTHAMQVHSTSPTNS